MKKLVDGLRRENQDLRRENQDLRREIQYLRREIQYLHQKMEEPKNKKAKKTYLEVYSKCKNWFCISLI